MANFGHYNKVYGSLAGVIIFLIWMWISNVAILLGAEFNAELERSPCPADAPPQVDHPPRGRRPALPGPAAVGAGNASTPPATMRAIIPHGHATAVAVLSVKTC